MDIDRSTAAVQRTEKNTNIHCEPRLKTSHTIAVALKKRPIDSRNTEKSDLVENGTTFYQFLFIYCYFLREFTYLKDTSVISH